MLVTSERIIFVLTGFIGIALCMPAITNDEVYLVDYQNERFEDGSYAFNYELSDGQSRTEKGTLKDGKDADGNDIKIISVTGHYSFVAPSGQKFTTFYVADEKGYRVEKTAMTMNVEAKARSLDLDKADDEEVAAVTTTESGVDAES